VLVGSGSVANRGASCCRARSTGRANRDFGPRCPNPDAGAGRANTYHRASGCADGRANADLCTCCHRCTS
jgi:hypothetical protein